MRKVEDLELSEVRNFSDLAASLAKAGGFMGKNVGLAVDVICRMIRDKGCVVFLSFTGNTVATGLRGVYRTLVRKRLVHAIITTIGALDHDLARSWKPYYQGDFTLSDEELLRKGMHRLGNLLIPFESYGKLIEEKMRPFLKAIYQRGVRDIATYELCELMGKEIARQDSMLYWAAKKGVPIVVPGPLDGAVGSQLWLFQQVHHDFRLNLFKDQELLSELVFKARRTGGMIIGGGISKHHLLWWNQFRNGLDYAVQITSAVEWDGSLSGARLGEAVSWKKVATHAKKVDVWGDATIIFPIIVKAALERLGL